MTKLIASFALCASLLALAGCDVVHLAAQQTEVRGSFDRTLTTSGPVNLEVRTGSGDVQVLVGAVDRVHVIGHIRSSGSWLAQDMEARVKQIEANPPIEQTGSTVRLGNTQDNPLFQNVSISYEITVPPDTQVRAQTGSGDQTIASVQGAISAQSGSGSIEIADTPGEVRTQTGSGEISVGRAGGGLDARTGSGDIRADSVGGTIRAQTGSGDIDVTQVTGADVSLQTGSGDVTLGLARNSGYQLDARVGSGSIRVAQPVSARTQTKHRLEGTIGGGGARVTVTTGSGSVDIR